MYNSDNVANMIKLRAKSKGVSVKQLLLDVGLGKNTMSNFKTSMPKADNLARIADYLDCSVDYLLGRTDNPEINRYQFEQNVSYLAATGGNISVPGSEETPSPARKLIDETFDKEE